MRTKQVVFTSVLSSIFTIIVAIALWFSIAQVSAQRQAAATGEGPAVATPQAPSGPMNGDGSTGSAVRGHGVIETGPDAVASAATYSYYYILGAQLIPRDSDISYAYDSNGCFHVTGGSSARMTFPVNLPSNSVIKYVRLYYVDTSASHDMTVWLTAYSPGQTSIDLTDVSSVGSAGWGSTLSSEITETVSGGSYQYTLNYGWGTADDTNQVCGVRVAYYAPSMAAIFLPLVAREATS
jgi:hypothetical protein